MVTKHISQEDYDLLQKVKQQKFKDLTDEEIWDWFKENTALTKESALMIARAILLKAQENVK